MIPLVLRTFDEGWCLPWNRIYIPEEGFAVRLEDDRIVTKDGPGPYGNNSNRA